VARLPSRHLTRGVQAGVFRPDLDRMTTATAVIVRAAALMCAQIEHHLTGYA